jgi:lysophospholipase I
MSERFNARFDIEAFGFDSVEDEAGMLQSAASINQLISAEIESGTEPSRILLGGFSQGATMSLLSGLLGQNRLAGIAVLSGWLPLRDKFLAVSARNSVEYFHSYHIPISWLLPWPQLSLCFGDISQTIPWFDLSISKPHLQS